MSEPAVRCACGVYKSAEGECTASFHPTFELLGEPEAQRDLEHMTSRAFAEKYGVSSATAQRWRRKRFGRSWKPHPEGTDERITELHAQGLPTPFIAAEAGLTVGQVHAILGRLRLKTDPEWARIRVTITKNPALRALHEEIIRGSE